ncbi:MAG: hypothetical protein LBV16_00915 [Elusimicrobiota bacterium]|jgi:hypothetical protein|nr:hypothetical protein [Elusimicrobiota bacterium]
MKWKLYNGRQTIENKILGRITHSQFNVFAPVDFEYIASYPQILRALKLLKQQNCPFRLWSVCKSKNK